MSKIHQQLHSLKDLIAYGNDPDDAHQASLFEFGDLIGEYVAAHARNGSHRPQRSATLRCRSRKSSTGEKPTRFRANRGK